MNDLEKNDRFEQRMALCRACDFRRDLPANTVQCTKCYCIMNLKARLDGMKCPVGKW